MSGNHGHGHAHANQQGNQNTSQAQPDVDAEHDPQRARKVSQAGLNREANKRKDMQENADDSAYRSLFASIDLLGQRALTAADDIDQIVAGPEDAGGIYKKAAMIEKISEDIQGQLYVLRMAMGSAGHPAYSVSRDLDALCGGLNRFQTAVVSARARLNALAKVSGDELGIKTNFETMHGDLSLMYHQAGLEMPSTAPQANSELTDASAGDLELKAIAAAEESITASIPELRAKIGGPEEDLHAEAGKLVAAVVELRVALENMRNPSRIHSTAGLAKRIHEIDEVLKELEKRPKVHEYVQNAGMYYSLQVVKKFVKK